MAEYAWKEWPEDCPVCGEKLHVFTNDPRDGWARDGDKAFCMNLYCNARGHISCNVEDDAHFVLNTDTEDDYA